MNQVVDERIVEMRFDNKQFEQNVKTSMSTLDKLKQKLKLKDASKGFEEMGAAANKVSFSKVEASLAALEKRFSTTGIIGMRVIQNLTDSAMRYVRQINSFVSGSIINGGIRRATNLENAQFQLQGLLQDSEKVAAVMKNVGDAVDGTAYSLDAAANVASQLAASGMEAGDEMFTALRGVAGVAAMTNSTYEDIGRIYTQVAGQGRMMGDQLLQLSGRGMNAAATLAKALDKTEAEVREMVSKGEIDFNTFAKAMDDAFGEHAKKANDTFSGALSNVKASLARIGAEFVSPLIKSEGPLVRFFNAVRERVNEFKADIVPIAATVTEKLSAAIDFLTGMVQKLGKNPLTDLVDKINSVVKPAQDAAEAVKDFGDVVDKVIRGDFGNGETRFNALTEAGYEWQHVQNLVNEKLGSAKRYTSEYESVQADLNETQNTTIDQLVAMSDAELKNLGFTKSEISSLRDLAEQSKKTGISLESLMEDTNQLSIQSLIFNSFKNIGLAVVDVIKAIGQAWTESFDPIDSQAIYNVIAAFHKFTQSIQMSDETLDKITRSFKGLFAIIDIITTITGGAAKLAFKGLSAILKAFDLDILDVTAGLGDALVAFRDFLFSNDLVNKGFEALGSGVKMAVEAFQELVETVKNIPQVQEFIGNLKNANWSEIGNNVVEGLKNGLQAGISSVPGILIEIGQSMLSAIKGVLGIHSPSTEMYDVAKNAIAGLVNGLKDGITEVVNVLKEIGSKLLSEAQKVDWDKVFVVGSIGASVLGGILTVKKLTDIMEQFAAPFGKLGKILGSVNTIITEANESIQKILKGFAKNLNAKAFKTRAEGLKEFAIAIGILAASIYALSQIDTNKMLVSAGVIAALSVVLVALAWGLNKLSGATVSIDKESKALKFDGLKAGLVGIGAALLLIAATVKIMGSMKPDEMIQGFVGLAGVIVAISVVLGTFGLLVRGESARNIDKAGKMLKKMSVALILMVAALKLIGLLSPVDLVKGVAFMGAFMIFTGLLSAVTRLSGAGIDKLGGMMIKMSVAMALMVGVCKLAGMLSAEEMLKGVAFAAGFVVFTAALKRAVRAKDGTQLLKLTGTLTAMAFALTLMVGVCKLAGMLSAGEMAKGAAAVVVFGILLVALVNAVKATGPEVAKLGGTLVAMTVAIGLMAGICVLMSLLDTKSLAKGLTVVSLLSAMMTAMIWATRGASDCKKNLIVMTAAIGVMAAAVAALSFVDSSKLAGATACLSLLMLMFALMAKASGAAGNSIKSMVVITVAIGALAGIVYLLAKLPVETTIPTVAALSALLLALSTSMLILSKAGRVSSSAIGAAAAMALIVTAMGGLISFLSQNGLMNVPLDAVASLSALLLTLSASCVILSKVGPMAGAAATGAGKLMAVLGIVSAVILAVGVLFSKLEEANLVDLDSVVTSLSKLGEALGSFLGNIVGGFFEGATDGLPDVAKNLKDFINTFSGLDDSAANNISSLMNALQALGSASLKNAIASILGHGLGDFGAQIGDFADQMNKAAEAVAGISDPGLENLKAIADIGQLFGELQSTIKPTGGILKGIADYNLGNFGFQIKGYARNLKQAATAVANISDTGLTNLGTIADIGKAFGKLQNTIAPTRGIITRLEKKDLGDFGEQISTYATNLDAAATAVAEISDVGLTNLGTIADIGTVFKDLQNTIAPTRGIVTRLDRKDLGDFGEQISTYATNLNTAASAVAELSDVGITNLGVVADIGTTFSDLQKSVGDAIDLFDVLSGATLDGFGEDVKDYVTSIKTASDAVSGENAVDEEAITKAKNIGDLLIELQKAIPGETWFDGKVDLGEFATRIENFGNAIGTLNEAASKGDLSKTNAVITFANSLKTFTQDITDGELATLQNFPEKIGFVADGIVAYYEILDGVDTAAVASSINSAYKIKSFVLSLSNFSSDGIENFKVEDLGQSLADYATKVASMDFTQVAGSITVATKLATFIKGLSGIDTSGVNSFKTAITTLGEADTSKVANAFNSASGDVTSAGSNIVDSLSKGISSKSSEATSAASGVVNKMNAEIVRKASLFLTAGMTLILKLAEGVRSNSSAAADATNIALNTAANSIRGFYGSFHESGSYVAVGLINGLNSQYHAVYEAGYRLGQAAIEGERAGQQSHSPSKLAEQSGVWLGEGLIIGIDSMGQKVSRAGESLGENVTGSLSSVISKASDLFELSMGAEPTITPVVDLTNVKAASDSMNGMFSNFSIGANANLKAVNVMMSNRGQNGNSDVVTAINKLGKKLTNMGNTYNIGGVTYDESSDVGMAIQTLTRAVLVEGRR